MQRILIVEDDVTISGGIRLYLQGKGFAADCAGTIARAETLLAGSSYRSCWIFVCRTAAVWNFAVGCGKSALRR
ncbi:MAG: hypothetical protein ACLUOF_00305 [Ruminococcus sp.]